MCGKGGKRGGRGDKHDEGGQALCGNPFDEVEGWAIIQQLRGRNAGSWTVHGAWSMPCDDQETDEAIQATFLLQVPIVLSGGVHAHSHSSVLFGFARRHPFYIALILWTLLPPPHPRLPPPL